jgi:hypothetical protein
LLSAFPCGRDTRHTEDTISFSSSWTDPSTRDSRLCKRDLAFALSTTENERVAATVFPLASLVSDRDNVTCRVSVTKRTPRLAARLPDHAPAECEHATIRRLFHQYLCSGISDATCVEHSLGKVEDGCAYRQWIPVGQGCTLCRVRTRERPWISVHLSAEARTMEADTAQGYVRGSTRWN